VELLDLGVEIDEEYNVGNTKYNVFTLRFKDFIWLISFGLCGYLLRFWVTITFGFSKSS
jgi:hypothetical protein